eukprot:15027795-Heterocapsa_arctica.AAC.1
MDESHITETVRQVEMNPSTVRNASQHSHNGNTVIFSQLLGSVPAQSRGSSLSLFSGTIAITSTDVLGNPPTRG